MEHTGEGSVFCAVGDHGIDGVIHRVDRGCGLYVGEHGIVGHSGGRAHIDCKAMDMGPRLEALKDVSHGAYLVARPVVVQREPYAAEGKLVSNVYGKTL